MVKTNTNTSTSTSEHETVDMTLSKLGILLDKVYSETKSGTIPLEIEIEEKPDYLDCGTVIGPDFALQKIDRDGFNPMYTYKDERGSVSLQTRYIPNVAIKVGDNTYTYGTISGSLMALEYLSTINRKLSGYIENQDEDADVRKPTMR